MKKFRRIICILLLLVILCSMNFGCINASNYTEEEHLARIEKRIRRKIDDWEYGGAQRIDGIDIDLKKCKYEDFAIYPLYDENEQFKYVLIEFEPYGFAVVYIDNYNHGLIDACLGNTMYSIEKRDVWHPYSIKYNGTSYYKIFQYNESGEAIYYNKSPYYVTNNLNSRKYLFYTSGNYIPTVKQGEVYINLISGETLDIANDDLNDRQPNLGGMFTNYLINSDDCI